MAENAYPEPDFDAVDDVGYIRVDQIEMGERLRPVDEGYAAALGQVLLNDGQRTPIEVCRHPFAPVYTLVTGAHRLRAAQIIELVHIKATVISASDAERKIAEISENLFRRELDPYDRATFVAELMALKKARVGIAPDKDGRAASAAARWQKTVKNEASDTNAKIALVYGWAEETADAIGFSRRTVYDDVLIFRRLTPPTVDALRSVNHAILRNASQLKALAKLDAARQTDVVAALLGNGRFGNAPSKTVSEAIARVENKQPKPADDKRLSAFIGAFNRMGLAEKRGALAMLADILPAGWSLTAPEGGAA